MIRLKYFQTDISTFSLVENLDLYILNAFTLAYFRLKNLHILLILQHAIKFWVNYSCWENTRFARSLGFAGDRL